MQTSGMENCEKLNIQNQSLSPKGTNIYHLENIVLKWLHLPQKKQQQQQQNITSG